MRNIALTIVLFLSACQVFADGNYGVSDITSAADDSGNSTLTNCYAFRMPEDGTLATANFYCSGTISNWKMSVYTQKGVVLSTNWLPDAYVANSQATGASAVAAAWKSANVTTGATLTGGVTYWICVSVNSDSIVNKQHNHADYPTSNNGHVYCKLASGYASFPVATMEAYDSGRSDAHLSAYYTYTTGGAPAAGTPPKVKHIFGGYVE